MTGDIGPAQKHFPAVLEMEAPEDMRGLERDEMIEGRKPFIGSIVSDLSKKSCL